MFGSLDILRLHPKRVEFRLCELDITRVHSPAATFLRSAESGDVGVKLSARLLLMGMEILRFKMSSNVG